MKMFNLYNSARFDNNIWVNFESGLGLNPVFVISEGKSLLHSKEVSRIRAAKNCIINYKDSGIYGKSYQINVNDKEYAEAYEEYLSTLN